MAQPAGVVVVKKLYRATWDERVDAAANARRELPRLATDYFTRARKLLAEDPPPAKLHALRLDTKRLRYTLELFRPCYGPGLEARLQELRRIQQLLGEVNDSVATAALLPKGARGRRFLENRAEDLAQEFRKHWAEAMDAPGQVERWTAYLSRNTRRR
jgi:CHAD domain-containing protein